MIPVCTLSPISNSDIATDFPLLYLTIAEAGKQPPSPPSSPPPSPCSTPPPPTDEGGVDGGVDSGDTIKYYCM